MNNEEITPHLILGVDPGLTGAIAVLDENKIQNVFDMPTLKNPWNKSTSVDPYRLGDILDGLAKSARFAMVEEVSSMPKQGVVSTFSFGKSYGMVLGALGSHMIPIFYVKPAVWKAKLGLSRDKNQSRGLAAKFYPEIAAQVSRAKDDGRAEAVLLAHYGINVMKELERGKAK